MTSAERHSFFMSFMGEENALKTNALFESKLLLKDQQRGMITWAKTLTGMKPEVQRDFLAKVQRLDKVLEPEDLNAFLSDFVEQRLGLGVSTKEASEIAGLSKKIAETKAAMETGGDRLDYGRARVAFANYVNNLKLKAERPNVKEFLTQNPLKTVSDIGGQAKSIKASLDNSAIFRQGWKTLFSNPIIWGRNARKSFSDLVRTVGGAHVLDELNADIVSRPTYDAMKKAGLAVGNIEEAFPSALPEKIPGLGRIYKASESAYTAFVQKTRADVFDKYLEVAKQAGVDVTDEKQLKAIGKVVNSLTGRGNLGRAEPAADFFNNVFFSPRFLKSNIDLLTVHALDSGMTPFARKQAAMNLAKVVAGTAIVLMSAEKIGKAFGIENPVEWDSRSSDFGKIKIGNTRFDVTGGMGSIITLATRLARQSSKSTTSGNITKIDDPNAYKGATTLSTLEDFLQNKLSPLPSFILALRAGQDRFTKKPINLNTPEGLLNSAQSLAGPIPIANYQELAADPNSANDLAAMIADGLGISVNDYAPTPKKK